MGRVLPFGFRGGGCGKVRQSEGVPPCKSTDNMGIFLTRAAGHPRPLQWHYLICIVAYFLSRGKKKERDSISPLLLYLLVRQAGGVVVLAAYRVLGHHVGGRLPSRRWRWHHAASPSSQQRLPCGRRSPHTPRWARRRWQGSTGCRWVSVASVPNRTVRLVPSVKVSVAVTSGSSSP